MIRYLLILLLIVPAISRAQTSYTWVGSTSTDWGTASNWSPSGVPSSSDHIVLNTSSGNQPVLDASHNITNITVSAGTLNLNGYNLTITGSTTLTGGTINNGKAIFSNTTTAFGGTTFGAKVDVSATNITFASSIFNEIVTIVKTGPGLNTSTGGNTFNDTLDITLNAGSITLYSSSNDNFNNYVFVANTDTGTVAFGDGSNSGTLANGKKITIGSNGFDDGKLLLNKFIQTGSTTQSITLTSSAGIEIESSTFNGALTLSSPDIIIKNSTFNSNATFDKTGSYTNYWYGGNTYNGSFTLNNSGAGDVYLSDSGNDIYNGDATFARSSSGHNIVSVNGNSSFYANVNITSGANVNFGTGSGRIFFRGSNNQTISKSGSGDINISRFTINKSANYLTLNYPVFVSDNVTFTSSKMITSSTNILVFGDDATATSFSGNSYIDGPAKKIGNDAFIFPIGKNSAYRPIGISAPSSTASEFRAEYEFGVPLSLYAPLDTGYSTLTNCDRWTLTRAGSTSNVKVTLSWSAYTCSNYIIPARRVVAGLAGGKWRNYGNASYTGNKYNGTVTASDTAGVYNVFTWGINTCSFTADAGVDSVTGPTGQLVNFGGSPTASGGTSPYEYTWKSLSGIGVNSAANFSSPAQTFWGDGIVLKVEDVNGCRGYDTVLVDLFQPEVTMDFSGCTDSILRVCIENPEYFIGQNLVISGVTMTNCDNYITIDSTTHCINCIVSGYTLGGIVEAFLVDSSSMYQISDPVRPDNYHRAPGIEIWTYWASCAPSVLSFFAGYLDPDTAAHNTAIINWGINDSLGNPITTTLPLDAGPTYNIPHIYPEGKYTITVKTYSALCTDTLTKSTDLTVYNGIGLRAASDTMCTQTYANFEADYMCFDYSPYAFENIRLIFDYGDGDIDTNITLSNSIAIHQYDTTGLFTVKLFLVVTDSITSIIDADTIQVYINNGLNVDAGIDTMHVFNGQHITLNGSISGGPTPYTYYWNINGNITENTITEHTMNVSFDITEPYTYAYLTAINNTGCTGSDMVKMLYPNIDFDFGGCGDSTYTFCIDSAAFWAGSYIIISGDFYTNCDTLFIDSTTTCFSCTIDSINGPIVWDFYVGETHTKLKTKYENTFSWPTIVTVNDTTTLCYGDSVNIMPAFAGLSYFDSDGELENTVTIDWGHLDSLGNPVIITSPFQDGDKIILANYSHHFPGPGGYNIVVTMTNSNCGSSNIYPLYLILENGLTLGADNDSLCTFTDFNFNLAYNCFPVPYDADTTDLWWNFGDGTIVQNDSTAQSHAYTASGNYTVVAYITPVGHTLPIIGTDAITVHVNGPTAHAGADTTTFGGVSYTLGDDTLATGGTPPYTYWWSAINYEVGEGSNEMHPHLFLSPNVTDVLLQVTDSLGCVGKDTIHFNFILPDVSVTFGGCTDSLLTICIANPELFSGCHFSIDGAVADTNYFAIDSTTTC